ncbi:MAG: methylmalonyl-CoA epimerase [Alphaproteobacteria bacterium]|nr:methylmalonyl-CoA epimerase [Alphaproteobacteria bacterium]
MIVALDHIAIAVPDLAAAIQRFADDFGLTYEGTEDVEPAKTTTAFFPVPGTRIELVHPLRGEGAVQGFLDKRGGGLHHVCFRTDDLEADMERLKAKGYRFLSEGPQPGAHGTRVAFIHPRSCDGVLIELAEHPAEGHAHP